MASPYALMSINTSIETADWEFGRRFLQMLCDFDDRLKPELVSNWEEFKEKFNGVDACKSTWAPIAQLRAGGSMSEFHWDFFWKRKHSVKSKGWVVHTSRQGPKQEMAWGQIVLTAQPHRKIDWFTLFHRAIVLTAPEFGMLHLFTDPELERTPFGSPESDFKAGPVQNALADGIPNLAWATFFGGEFVSEVDANCIREAGFPIEPIDKGHLVRVTETIHDVVDDYVMFSERRANLKALFRDGLFLI